MEVGYRLVEHRLLQIGLVRNAYRASSLFDDGELFLSPSKTYARLLTGGKLALRLFLQSLQAGVKGRIVRHLFHQFFRRRSEIQRHLPGCALGASLHDFIAHGGRCHDICLAS